MKVFTIEEFQQNFDELVNRVEKGEHIGIIDDNGKATVMIPADDDFLKLYIDNNNEAC